MGSGEVRVMRRLKSLATDRRGTIGAVFSLLLPPVVMASGAAVDYARLEQFKTQLQATVDSAALAGAAAYTTSSQSGTATTVATNFVTSNVAMLPSHVGTITPHVSTAVVTTGSNQGNTVTVAATASIGTTIMKIFTPTLSVSATAAAVNPGKRVCILVTDPSSAQSLLVNSGVNITAPNCEIDVLSTNAVAAMVNSNLPNIAGLCIKGTSTLNSVTVNNLINNCTPASDPFAGTITAPTISTTCTVSNQTYIGTTTLLPGTYCGSINFNGGGTVTLSAGNYVFYNTTVNFNGTGTLAFGSGSVVSLKGTHLNINTGWTLNGPSVTFYYADASSYIQFNSGVTANLTAPTSGTYANVLMFEPSGLAASSFAIDGSSTGHLLQGLIYLPSRNITFNSTSNVTSDGMTLVAHQLILDTINWSFSSSAKTIGSQGANTYLSM